LLERRPHGRSLLVRQERSHNVGGFEEAKRHFDKISQPSETARSAYITRLVRMRGKAARQKTGEWKAIDNEIRQHPAPKDSDGKILSGRLVGKWSLPRHDYLYKGDGSWTMLPADEGTTMARGASKEISFSQLPA
jgi:hypothetical protein